MTTDMSTAFDVETLRRGWAQRDADTLAGLYADDAVITSVDRRNPPARPDRCTGRSAVRDRLAAGFHSDAQHAISDVVIADRQVAYALDCTYPNGQKVRCHALAELRDGRIVRETAVSAWDE